MCTLFDRCLDVFGQPRTTGCAVSCDDDELDDDELDDDELDDDELDDDEDDDVYGE